MKGEIIGAGRVKFSSEMEEKDNIKTKGRYVYIGIVTDATNASNDRTMALYLSMETNEVYVRNLAEFNEKFENHNIKIEEE